MNDLLLNELCLKIRLNAEKLPELMRDDKISDLCEALADINSAARDGGYRLNDVIKK